MTQPPFPVQVASNRSVLSIEGDDAAQFLQALVTADVQALAVAEAAYGALLTPQGKIHADFFILRTVEGFLIDCSAAQRQELITKLGFYKLRAKVRIAPRDEVDVGVGPGGGGQPISYPDPRLDEMGDRFIVPKGSLPHASGYDRWRVQMGLADSDLDIGQGRLFPHEANLDLLSGVSFSKGCYIGQEVVSRMQHRGTARSRIMPVRYEDNAPAAGSELVSGDKPIGMALSSNGFDGLALVRLDRLADVQEPILTAGVTTAVHVPAWMEGKISIEKNPA